MGFEWRGSDLMMRAERRGEVLGVAAFGVLTLASVHVLREYVGRELHRLDARAVVVDLRGTVYALGAGCWEALCGDAAKTVETPVAIVVSPALLSEAREYCKHMAKHAVLRVSFTDAQRAFYWASQCRFYWQHEPVLQLRRPPESLPRIEPRAPSDPARVIAR